MHTLSGVSRGVALILVILAFLSVYAPSFAWMLPVWLDYRSHYGHGPLVIGLVSYLLWQERRRLPGVVLTPVRFTILTLAMLIAASIWFAGATAGIRVPTVLAGISVAWLAMSLVLGRGGLWRLAPYFALIFSIVPIWQVLSPALQFLATRVVNSLLQTLGLTIFMEGNTIVMPEITFEIVGGCSGLGFLLVAFTLAVYLAVSHRLKLVPGCFLLLGFGAMAIFANWLRITLIMLVGYYDGAGNALVQDHLWFGWAIFATILFAGIFFLLPRLPVPEKEAESRERSAEPLPVATLVTLIAAITALPLLKLTVDTLGRWNAHPPSWVAPADPAFEEISRDLSSAGALSSEGARWQPEYPTATRTRMKAYQRASTDGQNTLRLFQAYYRNQTDRAEVIDADNDLAGDGWESVAKGRSEAVLNDATRSVGEVLLTSGSGERMAIWFWYRIGDTHTSSDRRAKIEQVLQKLQLRADAMLTAVAAPCGGQNCVDARQELRAFTEALRLEEAP